MRRFRRRGNPLARARSLRELVDAEWVRAGTPAGPARVVDEAFVAAGLPPPRYRVQCETVLALSELAASGDFVAVVPQQVLAPERGGGRLVRIAVREHIAPVSIAVLARAQAPLTPLAREFIRMLRDRVIETNPFAPRFYVGLVLWQPGELQEELKAGIWSVQRANESNLFDKEADGLWKRLSPAARGMSVSLRDWWQP